MFEVRDLIVTLSRFCPHTRAAAQVTAGLNNHRSSVHSWICRNKDCTLSANVFLSSLSTGAFQFIRKDFLVLHIRVGPVFF